MRHILTIVPFKSCRIFSELITVKLTAISAANAAFWSPCDWLPVRTLHYFPSLLLWMCVLMLLEGISWGNKPENSQIRPNKRTRLAVGDTVKSTGSFSSLWDETHRCCFNEKIPSFAIRVFLGLQRIWLLSSGNSQIWSLTFLSGCTGISLYSLSQYPSAYSSVANSCICKIPMNPSSLNCFGNKKKEILSAQCVKPEKDSAFVNANINIPHNLCGAVSENWGLADWFSFLTRTVERQFNFLSSPASWETIFILFYFCAFLSKKCQHDFVSTKHILCCDRYHLTPIYERRGGDTSP